MGKRVLLFSLASISCIPAINELCSNYNLHNVSINKVNDIQSNIDLSDLNDIDIINKITETAKHDDEMPNYSEAKESWNKEINDSEHKSFQKFNLSTNELSALNLSLNNDKDKIIKEGNDCLEYAQDNNMNLGKFKTFISEAYKPQEQLEQNPQLSKFSSIFKGHKDDDTDDIKDKIVKFKEHSSFMFKLFCGISVGLIAIEITLIVIYSIYAHKTYTKEHKKRYNEIKSEIEVKKQLLGEVKYLYNHISIKHDSWEEMEFAMKGFDEFFLYQDLETYFSHCGFSWELDYSDFKNLPFHSKLIDVFPDDETYQDFILLFLNNTTYKKIADDLNTLSIEEFIDTVKSLYYTNEAGKPVNDIIAQNIRQVRTNVLEKQNQLKQTFKNDIQRLQKELIDMDIVGPILWLLITWIAPMILEALMITIIYPTFFTKTCNKLLSQSKSNYDKDTFHQIEKSIEIAKKTVIYVTTIIDIASLIFNFIFIYKANSSTWVKWLFVALNTASAAGIAIISTYVYKDIEKIEDLSNKYQTKLEEK